ncbi:MAG TPA: hypothetical protein VMU33_11260 [Burkholderiaceae bacterium]|nr:hypothetical protein [Burkholderiaceae bacterium]
MVASFSFPALARRGSRVVAGLGATATSAMLAAALLAGSLPVASAQSAEPGTSAESGMMHRGDGEGFKAMQARHQEFLRHRLDAAAERLELKASQMPAWQAFAAAFTSLHEHPPMMEPGAAEKLDGAAMIRASSDHAADHARKLAAVADAAVKLQATMSGNQKSLFAEMVRHYMAHHHGPHAGPRPPMHRDGGGSDGPHSSAGIEGPDDDGPHPSMMTPE